MKKLKKSFESLSVALVIATIFPRMVSGETIYFLVGFPRESDWSLVDSYVLPLSKQEDINHARFLISLRRSVFSDATNSTIVAARVGPGKDGINRNYADLRFPEWSWHVVEFLQFGDSAVNILNGTATYLEHHPEWYSGADARGGLIGFWAYTVVRELGPSPLFLSVIPDGQNLQFYWTAPGTNSYTYTLEACESLASTNWLAVSGASWPLNTNHWTLPLTNAPAGFYRVRAEPSG